MSADIPLSNLKTIDAATLKGLSDVYITPATALKHVPKDFNGHFYMQPNAKEQARMKTLNSNAALLYGLKYNILVEGNKFQINTDKEGGICGMCQTQKIANFTLNSSGTTDCAGRQVSYEAVVDAANNIAIAVKDAPSGTNPLVFLYNLKEFNLMQLCILQAGQDPIVVQYEKPNFF